ncbi:uncharacterized protein DNG_04942 [Cephalotrichum gorgonifer]|uniref:Uncharacterized protein n=1 Tax=Cephalotrichum gorgonifer TaxID=2041049 RepID=A0AAE8MYV7_9PEZI|nr:uncharacterized protein DNG_04942 [Cephalotrichum gorgonifer]
MASTSTPNNVLGKIRMPSGFLSLAPATSGTARVTTKNVDDSLPRPPARRSSSLSSTGSAQSYRVLKLAPVHLGEHAHDHKQDWHDIAVEIGYVR